MVKLSNLHKEKRKKIKTLTFKILRRKKKKIHELFLLNMQNKG
jgi:hypothetical protein